ncbi:MAG: TrkH family potassium uptake protein [Erysipelotrichales bacterium]|nr:TrkH family potassium uptake protein [Erysipelotrichales bacterium]
MNNYRNIFNTIGRILQVEAILMIFPLIVAIIYKEPFNTTILAFGATAIVSFVIGLLLNIKKAKSHTILPRESFIIVTLSWVFMSLVGCIPLIVSRHVPNFFDAFFEMCSGFTTTGATILTDVEIMPHSILFWRSFSHWIGGMGVIVFILAILPDNKEGSNMHILRAESPGPQVGKLTSKISVTARILYLIYVALTVIEFLFLVLGPDKKMDLFSSITLTLGTAGTGGFAVLNDGIASYAPYSQYVIATFMLLFGINFSLFYMILIGKIKGVFKNEELRLYLSIVIISIVIIVISLTTNGIYGTFEERFRHSFFQVASIISTTGYSTTDYAAGANTTWSTICFMVIIFLMLTGPCAGSTGGGIKLSRINILCKSAIRKIKQMISPRKVVPLKDSGAVIEEDVVQGAESFFVLYMIILFVSTMLISFDGKDLVTNFTASLSCISNIGPGLGNIVGPAGNFSSFSSFSKFVLSITMITGRLELFPMLALFNYKTWKTR